ncbi:hypothetical protein ES703_69321 [subsurface metagenome]
MKLSHILLITADGRVVTLTEPDDHILQLEVDGQVIARFSQTGVTVESILKEVKTIGREN